MFLRLSMGFPFMQPENLQQKCAWGSFKKENLDMEQQKIPNISSILEFWIALSYSWTLERDPAGENFGSVFSLKTNSSVNKQSPYFIRCTKWKCATVLGVGKWDLRKWVKCWKWILWEIDGQFVSWLFQLRGSCINSLTFICVHLFFSFILWERVHFTGHACINIWSNRAGMSNR